jgi:CheY-like chemotaxis protein
MLDEVAPTDALRDDVEEIVSASDRAAGVIRQLLLFSRRASSNPTVVDLKHAVDGIRRMLKRLLGEDVRLLVEAVAGACAIRADRSQIDQILMNLVINARDAMPDGGTLQIRLERVELRAEDVEERESLRPGWHVRLSVSDTGTGMDPEVQEHLFEPFFTTKDPGKGTGLGLATVFGMVRENDGHIEVRSDLGRGSTFTIHFPEVPLQSVVPVTRPSGEPGLDVNDRESPDRPPVVLVAEDESAVRALVRRVLIRQGYEVLEACDGAEAEYVSDTYDGRIDLLLTDTVMPGLRGPEVAQRLALSRPELSILFMSGYTFDEATVHTIPEGAPFLSKPFTPEALDRAVRNALAAGKIVD